MYQPSYPGYQPLRPPTQLSGPPPPLHIQTAAASQPPFHQYSYTASPAGSMATPRPPAGPPSPSEQSERSGAMEEDFYNLPGPPPISHIWNGFVWALEVVQHPQRARMCGFGDKDRRPISPPPCIRLVIYNPTTKQEINYEEIDLAHLVLAVDIWDLHATRELNLVKQSNASPCISSAATGSFPTQAAQPPQGHEQPHAYPITQIPNYQSYTQSTLTPTPAPTPATANANPYYPPCPSPYQASRSAYSNGHPDHRSPYQNGTAPYRQTQYPYGDPRPQPQPPAPSHPYGQPPSQQASNSSGPPVSAVTTPGTAPPPFTEHTYLHQPTPTTQSFTRNLIGSLSASAFKLHDENGKLGIWFVLQDLSVRTEGWFRLKLNFFNLSRSVEHQIQSITGTGGEANGGARTETTAPCLASAFSNPFKVFSAKKFPGVVESTPLSRAFATQGIKIPIRKDPQGGGTGGKRGRDRSDDDDDGSDNDS